MSDPAKGRRALSLFAFVWAGESVYLLPYALRRDYTQALLDALHLQSEAALGTLYSFFGAASLMAYVAGGWIADRVTPRTLLIASLVLTAFSGGWLATFPESSTERYALFGFWSVATILLFWAALIKATRRWGGTHAQGRAFGILDGGRGLLAAALGSSALPVFAAMGGGTLGLQGVIGLYSGACLLGAVLISISLTRSSSVTSGTPEGQGDAPVRARDLFVAVLRRRRIWLLGGIVFCAYASYLGTFYFAGFAAAGYEQGDAGGAAVSVFSLWLRPPAALVAGLLADRLRARSVVIGAFALLAIAYGALAFVPVWSGGLAMLYVQAGTAAAAAYALRGVFYAMLAEGGLPSILTGTAVGVVSFLGYLPDVLTPYVWGLVLDAQPGAAGYHSLFGSLALASLIGVGLAAAHGSRTSEKKLPE